MPEYKKLLEPGKIGKLQLKNRVVLPPMATRYCTNDGFVSDRLVDYYAERARGGMGLIILEATYPRSSGYPGRIFINDDRFIPGMRRLAEAVHREGPKIGCQLNVHRGRADEHDPASSSAVPHPITGKLPRVLTIADIKKLEEDFGLGAKRIKEAGFDCVMIHGASGYLVSEFLSPRINQRTDEYGGDLQGRVRFALELVEVTRKNVGPDYPIIFRFTADERVEGGWGLEEAIKFCKMLQGAGIDAIDITTGSREADEWNTPSIYMMAGCNASHSEAIKREVKVPIMVAGKINDLHLADEILSKKQADFVDMGRVFIAEPLFLKKALEGRREDICVCIGCLKCTDAIAQMGVPIYCSVNPAVGREEEFRLKLKPVKSKKKVLVVGGGPGGMEAAIIAARRGHDVTLWEASDRLGGELKLAAIPVDKNVLNSFVEYLKTQMQKLGVVVMLKKKANAGMVSEFAPDAAVIAVGSLPFTPDIPGANGDNVVGYSQVLRGERTLGKKIVVMGGGFIGCETAMFLAEKGKEVTLEFPEPQPVIVSNRIRRTVVKMLQERNVKVMAGIKQHKEITPEGIKLINKEGDGVFLPADNIVLATGSRPNKILAQSLEGKVPEVYQIGDCLEVNGVLEAVHTGTEAGLKI